MVPRVLTLSVDTNVSAHPNSQENIATKVFCNYASASFDLYYTLIDWSMKEQV